MARVLVTGATGFIGRHLVAHLLERGDTVRCLMRRPHENVAGTVSVPGDVSAPETLADAVRDVDVVYHLAGATLVPSVSRYQPINSVGTRNLAEACVQRASPPTLLYLSSLAAAGPSTKGRPRVETDVPAPVSEYGRSKLLAEHFLREMSGRLPITVVRPPGVFGPGDANLFKLFAAASWGFNVVAGDASAELSLIAVDDLVRALPVSAERGERMVPSRDEGQGVYYMALADRPTLRELGILAGTMQGRRRVRTIVLPTFLGRVLGWVNDLRSRIRGRGFLLSSDKMREALAGSWTCSSAKASRDLGFACARGLADGFRKTVAWYREEGWL